MRKIFLITVLASLTLFVGCTNKEEQISIAEKIEISDTTEKENKEKEQLKEDISKKSDAETNTKSKEELDKAEPKKEKLKKESTPVKKATAKEESKVSGKVEKPIQKPVENPKNKIIPITLHLYNVEKDIWITEKSEANLDRLKDIVIKLRNHPLVGLSKNVGVSSVTVKERVATVDMGKEFNNPQHNTSAGSTAKIFSIVNTLCLNKELGIDKVMFLIEGKRVQELGNYSGDTVFTPSF
ncbi:GerMN domain-containing protein [Clostridium chrysemydis]|uniref:GerMN domain-containing protein n=1 Tax=Clostridium chrysemydis TaxID=2665504 RepID=UPI001883D63A|nr:GerMN domain-containing protein [Clostridium chrysemydis]